MTTEFIIRILVATVLGAVIGLDREYRTKAAGFRTHVLVALGSALFMIISVHGFDDLPKDQMTLRMDPARIAAQVVTGIGFIGAGTIIFQKNVVKGLTTADRSLGHSGRRYGLRCRYVHAGDREHGDCAPML